MEILADKIDEGFAFPLNPKWILCDEGWKDLYDKLLASERPNVQDALNVWYPADVRARIAAISSKHPIAIGYGNGPSEGAIPRTAEGLALMKKKRLLRQQGHEELFSAEIAELELERYKHARRGVVKLRRAVSKIMEKKMKKKKMKKHSFFSFVLLMLQIGIEADAQMEKGGSINTGRKKMRDRLRRRSSVDSSDHSFASFTSAPSERSASSEAQADGKDMHDRRPSRRRSLTRYIRKRLSLIKKKSQSSVDTEQS